MANSQTYCMGWEGVSHGVWRCDRWCPRGVTGVSLHESDFTKHPEWATISDDDQ